MWQPKKVEQALLHWDKWRCSLIDQWGRIKAELSETSPERLRLKARRRLRKIGLSGVKIEVYWICSLVSDLNLDHYASFDKIVIPDWLRWWPLPYHNPLILKTGARIYPPWLLSENDIDFAKRQYGPKSPFLKPAGLVSISLPPSHELYSVIEPLRGRPKKQKGPGRAPRYPDHLAVKCAILRTKHLTYIEIAKQLGLPVTKPELSEHSDVVRHLTNRGSKLIEELKYSRLK
jgi:hypothetical protein